MDILRQARGAVFFPAAFITLLSTSTLAQAWDEEGHAIVTRLAWEKLPDEMPGWLKTPEVRFRLEYLSNEPDRWRGQDHVQLDHCNNANHYLDIDDLAPYGLTIKTLPLFRREFLDRLATERALHPDKHPARDPKRDRDYTYLIPGLLPYEIAELQWKIASSWTTLKTYEKYREHVTDEMIDNARQNVIYQMGIISHFIGDGAQPLHTTRHHHGWEGANPNRYTTKHGFHAYIDGGVIRLHNLTTDNMAPLAKPARRVTKTQYWRDICGYLDESFALVEPLYILEKSGELKAEKGKAFIQDRLVEGGSMLAGVWAAAYKGAVIDDFRVNRLLESAKKSASGQSQTGG